MVLGDEDNDSPDVAQKKAKQMRRYGCNNYAMKPRRYNMQVKCLLIWSAYAETIAGNPDSDPH